ncbi:MAG TPA: TIGR01777 family oxidoreductase [Candidatus Eremiobacteraceae bacterium]|nr:TIGR01777 family oxidoreductase [Candidatus Eremiobacteraceae bacterium]
MRVGVTGASGFIGRAVVAALRARGDVPIVFTRSAENPASKPVEAGAQTRFFDVGDPNADPSALEGLDAIVHLAGESVDGRWTEKKKRAIYDSRVKGTHNLVAALEKLEKRPRALIAASATGYYGDRRDEILDEQSAPASDFLARVCVDWERETRAAGALGIRQCSLRTGIVLGQGGAMGKLQPIFSLGAGGPIGSGRQWMPWIHIDDLVAMYLFALDRSDIAGAIGAVAPDYASNARVMAALAGALGRPSFAVAPAFALRPALGEFAESILAGQLLMPRRASELGFAWRHPTLEAAMADALGGGSGRKAALHVFESEKRIASPLEEVFAFFSETRNLERLTPPELKWRILSIASTMRLGTTVDYSLRVHSVPIKWRSLATEWVPDQGFTDVQVRGPYLWWKHVHRFEREGSGTLVRDRVEYALPLAPLGEIARSLVRRDIESAFAFRRRVLGEIFPG